jgi:hypothetical protein
MGFEIVENPLRTIWMPVDFSTGAKTLYEGSIVMSALASSAPAGEGINAIGAAAGASDTTGKAVPFGVVVGFNNATQTYDSTYKGATATSVGSQANQLARDFRGAEGMFTKGDPCLLAKIAVIGTDTILKGRIFNGGYGTALTAYSNTAQSTTGGQITTTAVAQTPVTYNHTWYCRSGKNMGLYRTAYSTSTTAHTFYITWPYDTEVGDSFAPVFLRLGTCLTQFDAASTYIEAQPDLSTNNYIIDVFELHMETSGEEYAIFRFNADQFCAARA